MIRPTKRQHVGRLRRGATLVEILIACVMMSVALMGLLGTSRRVAEATGATRQQIIADGVIQSRLDSLESMPCSSLANGSRISRGITEAWTITPVGKTRQIDLTIAIPRLKLPISYRTIVPCI